MPLRHELDVAQADWFSQGDDPWRRLCSIGPSGFARYVRLFHPLESGADEANPDHLMNVEGHLEQGALHRLLSVLERHTSTPLDCYFGLWDGFGAIHGGRLEGVGAPRRTRWWRQAQSSPPAFPPQVMTGPRVSIPARDYLLFRGPLNQAGHWDAEDLVPGQPREINSPNLMWPADHAWFTASEIDLPWTGIAGAAALIEDLLADRELDVEIVEPSEDLPYWRSQP